MGFFSSFHSDKFSTHEGQCGSCGHSTVSNVRLSCYCNERRATYKLNETKCRYYVKDNSRDYNFWREIYTYYILTAIFDILNLDKSKDFYQEIMTLIQLVREDETTVLEAVSYDSIGKEIANKLRLETNREEICLYLFEKYLLKVYNAIKNNNQEEAIRIYKEMVIELHNKYEQETEFSNLIDQNMLVTKTK